MSNNTFDINKPFKTRDGRNVHLYSKNANGPFPIHGVVDGNYAPYGWRKDGTFTWHQNHPLDLVNMPERRKVKVWINVYPPGLYACHGLREEADNKAAADRIACIEREIEYTVGEGLEEGAKND